MVVSKMAGVLFEDIFNVKDIDPEGKKFDRGESETLFISSCIYKRCYATVLRVYVEFLTVYVSIVLSTSLAEVAGKHMV